MVCMEHAAIGQGRHGCCLKQGKTPASMLVAFFPSQAPSRWLSASPPSLSDRIVEVCFVKSHLLSLEGVKHRGEGENNGVHPCPTAKLGRTSGLRGNGRADHAPLHAARYSELIAYSF
jgi:hypothetical protein